MIRALLVLSLRECSEFTHDTGDCIKQVALVTAATVIVPTPLVSSPYLVSVL